MKPLATAGRLFHFLGIDRAVGFTLVGHAWNVVSGPVIITLIVWRLSASERAVLFNYVNIGDFQILFELGVGRVLQQFASRERAFLTPAADGTLTGDPAAKARLAALLRLTVRWLVGVMAVAAVVLLPGGWLFFSLSRGLEGVHWQAAWVLSVAVAGGQGVLNGLMLFMAGCGDVTPVARTAALQNMAMSLALACMLAIGAGLFSHPLSGMAGLAVALSWLLLSRRRRLADLWRNGGPSTLSWRRDIWPFQWRVGLSLLSVLLLMKIFIPMTQMFQGAEVTGRVGLSLYIMQAIQFMGLTWMETKVPAFGVQATLRQWQELDRMFRAVLVRSGVFIGLLTGAVVLVDVALYHGESLGLWRLMEPLLGPGGLDVLKLLPGEGTQPLADPLSLALLALSMLALHVVFGQTAYLRAHCREPLLGINLGLGLAVAMTLALTGWLGSARTMIAGYTACVLLVGLVGGTCVFLAKRRQWHA